jgi:hypothetical protein
MSNMGRGSCLSPFPPLYHSLSVSQVPTTDSFTNSLSVLIRSTLVKETISRFKTSGIFYAPIPITHTIAPCQDRMETAHGNLPKIGHDSIRLALGDDYWLYGAWTGNRTPLDWYTILTYNPVRQPHAA